MGQEIENGIRVRARELLSLGEVGCVVGHEKSSKGRLRPAFVYDEADADRLVWNESCHHNLVVYLRDLTMTTRRQDTPGRVAVVACPGMLDGTGDVQEHCQRCKERVPIFYDALVGEPPKLEVMEDGWSDVRELEALSPTERLVFWSREFDRCIRCYACRQACPGCYCFECLAEQVDPAWVSIAHQIPEKAFFHIMRAYHLAGRCVECHACDQACPMHIPLSLLNRKIAKEVATLFNYVAGGDPAIPPPLATFEKDEALPLQRKGEPA
jgi:ferredoxin